MSKSTISREFAQKVAAIVSKYGVNRGAEKLGMKVSSLNRRLRDAKRLYGITPLKMNTADTEPGVKNSVVDQKKDSMNISGDLRTSERDRVKILDEFLELHKVDLSKWEVDRYVIGAWDVTVSGAKSSTENDTKYTNFNIRVYLKPKDNTFDEEAFLEQFEEIIKKYNKDKVPTLKPKSVKKGENLLVLSINDLHLGRMSWKEETGTDYDSKIAAKYMMEGLENILGKINGFKIDHILYYVGHDFFTYDNATPFPHTTYGTPQEADSRWQKMFMIGEQLQITAIKALSKVAHVTVQEITGNHDKQASFYLGRVLNAVFMDDPDVTIDHSPQPRQYFKWGQTLLGAAHGKYEKPADLHAVMMAEARKKMGKTKYWYFVMGHQHHYKEVRRRVLKAPTATDRTLHGLKMYEEVDEDYKGLTITYLPNLAERDDYEVEHCFVGTIRGALAQIYSKKKGRIATIQYNNM